MRIGFEAKRATHNFRGLGNYSRSLIEGLIQYAPEEKLFLFYPPIKNSKGQKWIDSLPDDVEIRSPKGMKKNLSGLWRSFLIRDDIKKEKLDLFHGLSHEIPFFLGKTKYKKVVTMHDLIFLRYPQFFPLIDRAVYAQKFQYACKHADMVIAICEQTKRDLVELLGVDEKKIFVHYQSCSPLFYEKSPSSELEAIKNKYQLERPFILNVGAFEDRKNQKGLLEGYALVSHKLDEDLVLIGQGKKYKNEVRHRINELGLQKRVHLLDQIQHHELPLFYQASSAFCFPSFFEGFGIPIIEALFSGTPVITSHGSCFPESAGKDSHYIDPQSHSSIGEGLYYVLSHPELKKHMILKGREHAQKFHLENSTLELLNLYSRVTAN